MARTIVLLALLAVLVTCQSQNPGCDSIDLVALPLYNNNFFTYTAVLPFFQTANARYTSIYEDNGYQLYPWTTSWNDLDYSGDNFDSDVLDIIRGYLAANSTADRKIVLISSFEDYMPEEDFSNFIAAARRLKQSGVEIFVLAEEDTYYTSFWTQVASPNSYYPITGSCLGCNNGIQYHDFFRGITGMNSTGCSIMGANPRVSTFDGNEYTFNGLGDYWLVKSSYQSYYEDFFGFQVRMSPCDNSDPSSGTCVRAAAFRANTDVTIRFYIDPATGLLTVMYNEDIVPRYVDGTYDYDEFDDYYWYVQPVSLPGSAVGYQINIYYDDSPRQFGVVLGQKMGVNAFAVLNDMDFGSVVGLCGTFDGCSNNDYYSADQQYVNTGDSDANIYNGFSETWRVSAEESFFGAVDFDLNTYYYANYPQYSKNWTPRTGSFAVTTESAEACKYFVDKSKYLYETCTDSITMGIPDYAYVATGFLLNTCEAYCEYLAEYEQDYGMSVGFVQFAFIDEEFCQAICGQTFDWDFHDTYNATNPPPNSFNNGANMQNTYGATAQFVLGGTYTVVYASDYCDTEMVNATVTITCDQSPSVDAGADRTVSRTEYGFPAVYLTATASDVNSGNLQYSWKVIEVPLARNTTDNHITGYKDPHGYDEPADVELDFPNQVSSVLWPYYAGIYVVEVAVYDGCSISKDTVTINVTCDNCNLVITAEPQFSYLETPAVNSYSDSNLYTNPWEYQFWDYGNLQLQWVLDSTSNNYKIDLAQIGYNQIYNLYEVYTDNVVNTTTVYSNTTGSTPSSTSGRVSDGEFLNRYEGQYVINVITAHTDFTTTTNLYLNSIDREILDCQVYLSQSWSTNAIFHLETIRVSENHYPMPYCNGDYNFRVDWSDQCNDASEIVTVTHKCVKSPVAQLVTCNPNFSWDYNTNNWPVTSIQLDARDSYSETWAYTQLTYMYIMTSQPSWYTPDETVITYGIPTNTWPLPVHTLYSQTATWTFQVNVQDECSFGTSETASVTLSCDDQSPVITASATTLHSNNASAGWNQVFFNASASSNPHNSISNWVFQLVSGDPANVGGSTFAGPETTIYFGWGGSYSFNVLTYDGCWWKNSSVVTVNYVCDATLTPSVAVTPASKTAAYNAGWPTFTFDANGSVVNTGRMTYQWWATSPSGNVESLGNGITATLDTNSFGAEVGSYVITFYMDDGCKSVTTNTTVSVTCPALTGVPTIGVAGTAQTNGTQATSYTFYTNPQTVVTWYVYDSYGEQVGLPVTNVNYTLAVDYSGSYTATFTFGNGCASTMVNKTVSVTCQYNPTFTLATSTSTWSYNKFPKFTLAPTIAGQDADRLVSSFAAYQYTVLSAPTGSIWAPYNVSVTYSNITANNTYQNQIDTNLWQRTIVETTRVTTVTTTKTVTLNNGNEWGMGCFAADIAGNYQLQLAVEGYCGETILSTVTVTAQCNTAPVAKASYTQVVATGYSVDLPIVIDGLASTDADGDNLTYIWELISAPVTSDYYLNLVNNSAAVQEEAFEYAFLGRTQFYPETAGTYVLRLTVSDGCQNTTTDLTVVVSCNNNLALVSTQQSHEFDGFTPVSMSQFTFVATEHCNIDQYWYVADFVPAPVVTPSSTTTGDSSAASQVAMSLFALIALVALLL